VGSTVTAGAVVTEVNGRPVFAVSSAFDLYRDVGFGDEGPDVRAVQDTLVALGFLGYADGEFGAQTASAVRGWYEAAGYSAPTRVRAAAAPSAATAAAPDDDDAGQSDDEGAGDESEAPAKPVEDAYVPVSEVLAVSSLPAQVLVAPGVGAHVGVEGTDDLVLGAAEVVVRAEAPGAVATGIAEGDAATVLLEGEKFPGTVARIEPAEETSDGEQTPDILVVELDAPDDVPAEARGSAVTVQIVTELVAEDTLIVPSAGVVGRGGDDAVVVKKQPDGSLIEVPVTVVGTLRGMTGVTPSDADQLAEGDEIRVG
jgi:peptidoglycan hydrolase-like protein with peptidoglycan-binding domain